MFKRNWDWACIVYCVIWLNLLFGHSWCHLWNCFCLYVINVFFHQPTLHPNFRIFCFVFEIGTRLVKMGYFWFKLVFFLAYWNTVSIVSKKLSFFKFMSKLAKYIGILNSVYSMQVLSWSKLGIYWNFILFQQNFNNLKKSTD